MTLSEGGIGWIPYFLERADITHDRHGDWSRSDFGGRKPSEVFHDHIVTCFIDESFGVRNIADIGEDMVTWECDYPHADTTSIGRESCRESVGQYGVGLGGCRSIKKKTKRHIDGQRRK